MLGNIDVESGVKVFPHQPECIGKMSVQTYWGQDWITFEQWQQIEVRQQPDQDEYQAST